jgi:hypothetical protein
LANEWRRHGETSGQDAFRTKRSSRFGAGMAGAAGGLECRSNIRRKNLAMRRTAGCIRGLINVAKSRLVYFPVLNGYDVEGVGA